MGVAKLWVGIAGRAPVRSPAQVADFAGLTDAARRVYAAVMARSGLRAKLHAHGRDHALDQARARSRAADSALNTVVRQMARLAAAGATNAELKRFGLFLLRAADQIAPAGGRSLRVLDLEEAALDGREDELAIRRLHNGPSREAIAEEIDIDERTAAVLLERAAVLQHALATGVFA